MVVLDFVQLSALDEIDGNFQRNENGSEQNRNVVSGTVLFVAFVCRFPLVWHCFPTIFSRSTPLYSWRHLSEAFFFLFLSSSLCVVLRTGARARSALTSVFLISSFSVYLDFSSSIVCLCNV